MTILHEPAKLEACVSAVSMEDDGLFCRRDVSKRWTVSSLLESRLFTDVSLDPRLSLDMARLASDPVPGSRESRIVEVPKPAELPGSAVTDTEQTHSFSQHTSSQTTSVTTGQGCWSNVTAVKPL